MRKRLASLSALLIILAAGSAAIAVSPAGGQPETAAVHQWDEEGKKVLRSLWIGSLSAESSLMRFDLAYPGKRKVTFSFRNGQINSSPTALS